MMKKALSITFLAIILLFALSACGASLTDGKWTIDTVAFDGETFPASEYTDLYGDMFFSFSEDGTCSIEVYGMDGAGTYTQNGSEIEVFFEDYGIEFMFTFEDGKLSLLEDDILITFKKS